MGIRIDWLNENKAAIHWFFEKSWSWDDLDKAVQQAEQMFFMVDHRVHSIVEFQGGQKYPRGLISKMRQLFSRPAFSHKNTGVQIFVGPPKFVQTATDIVTAIVPRIKEMIHIVPTLDEGMALLEQFSK